MNYQRQQGRKEVRMRYNIAPHLMSLSLCSVMKVSEGFNARNAGKSISLNYIKLVTR